MDSPTLCWCGHDEAAHCKCVSLYGGRHGATHCMGSKNAAGHYLHDCEAEGLNGFGCEKFSELSPEIELLGRMAHRLF